MTIRINQIAVDFALERERTFADLTASLRAWANSQNLAVLGILADGKALGPDDQVSLADISEVDVEAVPVGERDLARVAVLARFFSLLAQGWERRDQTLISVLQQEFSSVREAVFPLLSPIAPRLLPPLKILDGPWTDSEALAQAALKVAREVENIRWELQNPVHALAATFDALEESLDHLDALAGLFQRGMDKDGLDLIVRLFTAYEDLGRRAGLARRGKESMTTEWAKFNTELQPFLQEAGGALEAGDYILLTDLLEYEVTPRLRSVRKLFPEVLNLDRVPDLL